MRTINIRTLHSETWQYGPSLCPRDMDMLLNLYCPGEYNRFSSEISDVVFYDVPTNGILKIIKTLSTMSEEDYKGNLSFVNQDWLDARDVLIADLQFLYDERDMTWADGKWMILGWF